MRTKYEPVPIDERLLGLVPPKDISVRLKVKYFRLDPADCVTHNHNNPGFRS